MGIALTIYNRLPSSARNFAASVRGFQLNRWRYGPETDLLAKEARERETWDIGHWQEWQQARLSRLLKHASETVPYYREAWQRQPASGKTCSPLMLQDWPVLAREEVRRNPEAFIISGVSIRQLELQQTSGTTGTPLNLWHSRGTSREWYALMEARWRGWYNVSRHDRWAILGGQLVTPARQKRPPFWVWNAGLKQLYLSSYHLSAESCASYLEALQKYGVTYLWGYASSLFSLALFARDQRLPLPRFKVVISNAEVLLDHERALISTVFGCPVRDTYGMCEMVSAAGECEHGRLHLWPEVGIVEVFADDRDEPLPSGEVGRLICTGLINEEMPLIRYDLGDRGSLGDPSQRCPCGRTLPILQSIQGRKDDIILTLDNRRIGRLDPVFRAGFPIREAQVIQENLTSLRVKVVPDSTYSDSNSDEIASELRKRVGDMSITVESVDRIPRGSNGKFQAVISLINQAAPVAAGLNNSMRGSPRPDTPLALRVYHRLPPFARNWAANLHGYTLKKARYGPATTRLAEEAIERDKWPETEWRSWLDERLRRLLTRAATKVPYYRQYWDERRRRGENTSHETLANWPILKKELLRTHPEMFVADDCDRRKMDAVTTSGTTGTPITLWRSQATNQEWYALYEARIRLWNGLSHKNRWGHIGGQPVVPFNQRHPPFWVWNSALRQLYLSCMHVGPDSSAAYLAAIKDYKLDYLLGYSSSIAMLAQTAMETRVSLPLKLVLTDSEPLLESQRSIIKNGFDCPVRETYGMSEIACAASECAAGKLHLWPEAGHLELLDENNRPVAPGQTGRIVATGTLNPDMPLIRYDTQDLAQAEPDDGPCACGRTLPRLRGLLGRNDDVIITKDGRRIVQIDRIFDPCYDIREAQIIQEAIGLFRIRIVPGNQWSPASAKSLCESLRDLVGEAQINIELVTQIERTWAGKYRVVISKVSGAADSAKSNRSSTKALS